MSIEKLSAEKLEDLNLKLSHLVYKWKDESRILHRKLVLEGYRSEDPKKKLSVHQKDIALDGSRFQNSLSNIFLLSNRLWKNMVYKNSVKNFHYFFKEKKSSDL